MHYRRVENGVITDIRFTGNEEGILIEDIYPLAESCKGYVGDVDKDSYYYHKPEEGFIYRLWKEFKGYLIS
jgi:hypothetical protein